jgi:hypothetical protein
VGKTSFDTAFNIPIYDNEVQIWGAEPGKAPISSVKKAASPRNQLPVIKVTVTGEKIFVATMPEKSGEFSVVNIEGKQFFKTSFKGSFTMNARKLGRGAYVAVVKTDGGSFISKMINLK